MGFQLCDALQNQIAASSTPESAKVDMLSWLSRATLDMIGLAGFNYSFDAIKYGEEGSELSAVFGAMFKSTTQPGVLQMLLAWFPSLRALVRIHLRFNSTILISLLRNRVLMHERGIPSGLVGGCTKLGLVSFKKSSVR